MKEVLVRFPNESEYIKITINWDEFTITSEFSDEYFGWYKGGLIAIKK
jgi:hypothetical protein